ncbi:YybH family protein [Rhodococcoides trifolii]|nr:DUF4440 domain-containing protein [Rhodococcus trifolii]
MTSHTTTTADAVAVVNAYGKALAAEDRAAIVALYAEDAEIIPENLPSLRSSAAIEAFYIATFNEINMQVTLQVKSAEVHDKFAVVRSEQPVMVTAKADGARIPSYFRELFVLRNTSAGWRICNYMFSQSPGQAETPA